MRLEAVGSVRVAAAAAIGYENPGVYVTTNCASMYGNCYASFYSPGAQQMRSVLVTLTGGTTYIVDGGDYQVHGGPSSELPPHYTLTVAP
jgi:hypothetical protein